jgi:hypothetical protein
MTTQLTKALATNAGLSLNQSAEIIWQMKKQFRLSDEEIGQMVNQPMEFRKIDYSDYVFSSVCGTETPRELAIGNNPYFCSATCKER